MAHRLRVSPLPRILPIFLALSFVLAPPARGQEAPAKWEPVGGPGGRLTHLAPGPDGRTLYAVSVTGVNRESDQTQWRDGGAPTWSDALYVSHNAGTTWQALTNDLPPGEITALYAGPAGQVWVAIRDRSSLPETRSGLWRSEDEGDTWRQVPLDRNDLIIRTISQDAGGQILLGAALAGGSEPGLVYTSAGGGETWTSQTVALSDLSAGAGLVALIPHPARSSVLFALMSNGMLLRSTDGGRSWQSSRGSASAETGSAQLAFLPDQPDTALLIQSQGATMVISRSTDAGTTWSEVQASGLPSGALEVHSILAQPGGVLLLNTDAGTYRSADGGRRWQPLEGALSSGFVRAWTAAGRDGRGILAATDYGLFASSDDGAIWRPYGTGLPANSAIAVLLTHKDRPAQIAASLTAPGDADPPELLLTRDAARTWLPADAGSAWSEATAWTVDPANPDNLYVAGQTYIATTRDGGLSWKVTPAADGTRTAIVAAPSDPSRVYVDGAPALRSDDGGQTWVALPLGLGDAGVDAVTGLAVHPTDATHLWAGTAEGVRESHDGGKAWQRSGLDGQGVRWLAVAEGTSGGVALYAGLVDGGIMRRNAGTADWQPADAGLPARSAILAFTADPRRPGLLWATRDGGGVYRSVDGGDTWSNVGVGLGDNLGLALAVNYQAPDSVLLGTATAGVWTLGATGPAPKATETPAGSPTTTPQGRSERAGVDARIEVVWPHDFAAIEQAELANVGIRLFAPGSLQQPACGWQPKVELWQALDNEPAGLVGPADQRSVDGQPFPYWEVNDVDVSAAQDGSHKMYFLVAVDGINTATNVWAHAADARTYFPEQQVPSGLATGAVDAVDARIQIVWPHDKTGAEASVESASLANVAVTLFKHGTRLSVPADWPGNVTLYGAWNSEVARPLATEATLAERQAGVITYPVWEFNDVPVDRAKDRTNKLYLWAVVEGAKSYPTVWAHGADARTFFPAKDEPIQGCLP